MFFFSAEGIHGGDVVCPTVSERTADHTGQTDRLSLSEISLRLAVICTEDASSCNISRIVPVMDNLLKC